MAGKVSAMEEEFRKETEILKNQTNRKFGNENIQLSR